MVGGDGKAVGALDAGDAMAGLHHDAGGVAFGQQHGNDLAGRAVAEQLAQRLLVPGDAVPVHQVDEVVLGVARQGRLAEVRIGRQEGLRRRPEIGEVAAPAARDQDLLADRVGMIEHQHAPAALAGAQRAHQPGRATAGDDDVEGLPGGAGAHASATLMIQWPSTRAARPPTTEPATYRMAKL